MSCRNCSKAMEGQDGLCWECGSILEVQKNLNADAAQIATEAAITAVKEIGEALQAFSVEYTNIVRRFREHVGHVKPVTSGTGEQANTNG